MNINFSPLEGPPTPTRSRAHPESRAILGRDGSPSTVRPRSPFMPVRAPRPETPVMPASPVLPSTSVMPSSSPRSSPNRVLRTAKSQPLRQALSERTMMPPPSIAPRSELGLGRPASPALALDSRSSSPAPFVVRAKITPSAAPRRKPLLPGTERADPPPPRRVVTMAPSRPASPTKSLMIGSSGPSISLSTAPVIVRSASPTKSLRSPLLTSDAFASGPMSISPSFYAQDPLEIEPQSVSSDSVLVCLRVKPCEEEEQAWIANPATGTVQLWTDVHGAGAFAFDEVVTTSNNEDVYRRAARGLVASTMEGFDACIFAYGQTASGKTFTLSGADDNPGLISRAVADVFGYIRAHPNQEFLLRASFLEIYNEQLKDLLADPPQLDEDGKPLPLPLSQIPRIRQDPATKRFFVAPLREEMVTTEASVHDLLRRGDMARHVGATDMNARSSRSHTVFQLVVESRNNGVVHASTLSMIDLAGSERATSQAERRAEGAFINRSLLTLEKVISALTDDKPRQHIPYRDSKLTQILQPSLGGEARVAVVCTIAPGANHVEESRSTLKFATRVKRVAVNARRHEIVDDKALITKYRSTIADLQAKLAASETTSPAPLSASTIKNADAARQADELKKQIDSLQTLFLTSANVDIKRDNVPRPVSPTKGRRTNSKDLASDLADALADLAASEDEVSSLREALAEARAEPPMSANGSRDDKDQCIATLMREKRELEVVLAAKDEDPDQWDAAMRREQRLTDQAECLRKDLIEERRIGDEAARLLEAERKHTAMLEAYIVQHFKTQADVIGRRIVSGGNGLPTNGTVGGSRRRSVSVGGMDAPLPSLVDEEPDLLQFSSVMARMSLRPGDMPHRRTAR